MSAKRMPINSRRDYLTSIYRRYRLSPKRAKTVLLNEFTAATGYHRQYALRLLNAPLETRPRPRSGRGRTYTSADRHYLKKLWVILDYPCGQRLKPMVPELLSVLERCDELTVPLPVRVHLTQMSWKTMDRLLALWRSGVIRRLHGTTKPGSLLKKQIPISLSRWNEQVPGFTELDLVAHCGLSGSGEFISTLNITDLASGWSEEEAVLGRSQRAIMAALQAIQQRLPFRLQGIDPDNDSAFINWNLFRYCLQQKIIFTRSRSYHKNDNAHIEQKNWTHVRKIVGYDRLETKPEAEALRALYRGPLRLYLNFFQPTMKLIQKERVGGRLKRVYDTPQTPHQRLINSPHIAAAQKRKLQDTYANLNPVALKREMEQQLGRLRKLKPTEPARQRIVTFHMTERSKAKLHLHVT